MVRLHRIGTDPEFLFVKDHQGFGDTHQMMVVPANTVISANKAKATKTFIGTDNHAATAEIRPTPSRHIKLMMYEMASAVCAIDEYLAKKDLAYRMYAQPFFQDEPLGGHIHTSFSVEDSDLSILMRRGVFPWWGDHSGDAGYCKVGVSGYPGPKLFTNAQYTGAYESMANRRDMNDPTVVDVHTYKEVMDYLLLPFEQWVQNSHLRHARNMKYGGAMAGDPVRLGISPWPEFVIKNPKMAYVHLEYRLPSSWLTHPWLAYVYLVLGKMAILNWDKIIPLIPPRVAHTASCVLKNDMNAGKARNLFMERMEIMEKKGARVTNDMGDLPKALNAINNNLMDWKDPFRTVYVESWRMLL